MAGIMTPETLEPEEMMNIPVAGSGVICRVVSGYANFYEKGFENVHGAPLGSEITGDVYPNDDDKKWTFYDVHMVVGPKWHDVRDVSPIVNVAGFSFMDNDSADASGIEILECKWDTVGEPEGQTQLERIRLKVKLRLCGGNGYSILKLSYHLVAVGR
jgi:hypothetical protein